MEPELEKTRRNFSPNQKVNILREHLIEHVPVSDVCDKHQIHPTLFYQWQKILFEKGSTVFENGRSPSRVVGRQERKLLALESKLTMRNEALTRYNQPEADQKILLEKLNLHLPEQPPPHISATHQLLTAIAEIEKNILL